MSEIEVGSQMNFLIFNKVSVEWLVYFSLHRLLVSKFDIRPSSIFFRRSFPTKIQSILQSSHFFSDKMHHISGLEVEGLT